MKDDDLPLDKKDAFIPKDVSKLRKFGKKRAGDIKVGDPAFGIYVGRIDRTQSRLGMELVEIYSEDDVQMWSGEADAEVDLDTCLDAHGSIYLTFERALKEDPNNPVLLEMKAALQGEQIEALKLEESGKAPKTVPVDKKGRPAPPQIEPTEEIQEVVEESEELLSPSIPEPKAIPKAKIPKVKITDDEA